ncbi:hypothetical protein D1006_24605 [Burkholderia stabilis]|uniref:Uncharacterized protein n=1 Tax=Burkholderia stabilis TaxID=95485 RepID=A0A4Q2AEX1_9BURK|nr:hypothetical protein D1006_24605 [Burkholderia stabilis]
MRALYVFFMTMPCRVRTLSLSRQGSPVTSGGPCAARSVSVSEPVHASVNRACRSRRCSDSS